MRSLIVFAFMAFALIFSPGAYGQELIPDVTYFLPDGSLVEGVRCATVDTAPADVPRAPSDKRLWWEENGHRFNGTIYIPVAFHVITAANGTGNVSDEQIHRQIDTLNAGYEGTGFGFYLSSVDRTANDNWFYNTENFDAQMKAALAIDPPHNLNLYTAFIGGGILGYAYLPWSFPESSFMHGVVVLYSSLPGGGSPPYNLGATATHEVGHYLGLLHTFERGCTPPGDEVDDTPYEASAAFGCPIGRNSCANEPEPDPIHNYMDYTDDACMFEMTAGQAERMDWAVSTYKPGLLEAAVVPNAPASFSAYSDYTTPTSIALSWEDPTSLTNGDTLLAGFYHLYIIRDGGVVDSVESGVGQYEDVGLSEGQSYSYEIYARLDSSELAGQTAAVSWIAGGSPIPGTPGGFGVSGNPVQVTLRWTNPPGNADGTPMSDFAGINVYQDGALAASFARTNADTGMVDSAIYVPDPAGSHTWYLTAFDSDIPPNESAPTLTLLTPLSIPLVEDFGAPGLPDPTFWRTVNADVNTRSNNPPSAPYALNLNGMPSGTDSLVMLPIDLTGMQSSGVTFAYFYQPQGNGNAPETGDSLRVDFRNDQHSWVRVRAYPGRSLQPFFQEVFDLASTPGGGGSYFHSQFQVRFISTGGAGTTPNDDWFIDNVFLGIPAPAIAASPEAIMFDTTLIGTTAFYPLTVVNVGLEDLIVTAVGTTDPARFGADTSSFTLTGGASLTVTASFTPDLPGLFTADLLFVSNDPSQDTMRIPMTGVGNLPVSISESEGVPGTYWIGQNYPNPFNPSTLIQYEIPVTGLVDLSVFNILGSRIAVIESGRKESGRHTAIWNGLDTQGNRVPSGVYFYRFASGDVVRTGKMLLVK
jgi:hypothetical protein